MAEKGTIETKLKLTGEDQYQKALKAAYGQLRVLNSELKASTSALGNNATAEQKNAVKAEVLRKKIAEQKKIVEQLKAALAQAKTEYAGNTEIIQKWQVKLNNAQTALNNMTNDLDKATNGVQKMSTAMSEGSSKGAQAVVNLGDVISSVKNLCESLGNVVTSVFDGIVSNIKTTVSTGWELITGAMADAHNWTGVKQVYGGSTADIEKMYRTAEYAGYSGTKMSSLLNKLVSRTHSGTSETMAALELLGINEQNYSNHFDYFNAVWNGLMQMSKTKDVSALTQNLFGKGSWEDAAGLIANWQNGTDRYNSNIEQTGIGLSESQIKEMDDAWHQINTLKTTWSALKTSLGTKIWIKLGLTNAADGVITLLQDVASLFENPGDKELILSVTTDLSDLITSVANSIGVLGTDLTTIGQGLKDNSGGNSTVSKIGDLLIAVGQFCNWIVANSTTILSALQKYLNFEIAKLQFQVKYPALYALLQNAPSFIQEGLTVFALMKTWKFTSNAAPAASAGAGSALATSLSILKPFAAAAAAGAVMFQDVFKKDQTFVSDLDSGTQKAMAVYSAFLDPNDVVDSGWTPEDFLAWNYPDIEGNGGLSGSEWFSSAVTVSEFARQLLQSGQYAEGFPDWLSQNGYSSIVDEWISSSKKSDLPAQDAYDLLMDMFEESQDWDDDTQYNKLSAMVHEAWPEMWDAWQQFLSTDSDEALGFDYSYFMNTWLPQQTGYDWSYYMPSSYYGADGGYWNNENKNVVELSDDAASKLAGALIGMGIQMDGAVVGRVVSQYIAGSV